MISTGALKVGVHTQPNWLARSAQPRAYWQHFPAAAGSTFLPAIHSTSAPQHQAAAKVDAVAAQQRWVHHRCR